MKEQKPKPNTGITRKEWDAVEQSLLRFKRPECLESITAHITYGRILPITLPSRFRAACRRLQTEFGFRKVVLHRSEEPEWMCTFSIRLEASLETQLHHDREPLHEQMRAFLLSHCQPPPDAPNRA